MPARRISEFNPRTFLAVVNGGKSVKTYRNGQSIFKQGDPADAVFYIECGKVKLTVLSGAGKGAVIAIMEPGSFFGEGCLAGQPLRMATAIAIDHVTAIRVDKRAMLRLLHEKPAFAESFTTHLLQRNIRIEEDLVDQLFNSSEKRLARILLLLAHFGKESKPEPLVTQLSQETLAGMIGTTRSRVSYFMNKFRKLGFIKYNGGLHVHSSLLNVVLHD
ncbi:MAG TPA: Crp/Fnr family transcriptional regulator [Terriglobia bacterium]|nr:Crp/Fnr family transcriptional regulator [Terriglobia bacterium]